MSHSYMNHAISGRDTERPRPSVHAVKNLAMKLILVVDDEADIRSGLQIILSLEGYRVITAANGEEGLQQAETRHPDLIISDIMMPRMNGLEMCRRLRRSTSGRDVPIILSSSIDPLQPLEQNWNAFLRKPVDPEVLGAEIRRLLERAD